MKTERKFFFGVFLSKSERELLHVLALESDRSASAVFRRLLTLAALPEAKKLLGVETIISTPSL